MNTSEWTDEAPASENAYEYNIPTGGLAENETPLYRGWTTEMIFEGDWEEARKFGILRSKNGLAIKSEAWPPQRIMRFPESVLASTNDQEADALLKVYQRNLRIMLETKKDTPDLGLYECRVRAAKAAQAHMNESRATS